MKLKGQLFAESPIKYTDHRYYKDKVSLRCGCWRDPSCSSSFWIWLHSVDTDMASHQCGPSGVSDINMKKGESVLLKQIDKHNRSYGCLNFPLIIF